MYKRQGDAALRSVWDAYLDNVAVVVNNLRMMLDCDVILGGYVGRYMDAEPVSYTHLPRTTIFIIRAPQRRRLP